MPCHAIDIAKQKQRNGIKLFYTNAQRMIVMLILLACDCYCCCWCMHLVMMFLQRMPNSKCGLVFGPFFSLIHGCRKGCTKTMASVNLHIHIYKLVCICLKRDREKYTMPGQIRIDVTLNKYSFIVYVNTSPECVPLVCCQPREMYHMRVCVCV